MMLSFGKYKDNLETKLSNTKYTNNEEETI